MPFTTLIDPPAAAAHLHDPRWVFVDCRSVLGQPQQGRAAYLQQHLPGAVYADLEHDLSGPVERGRTGRHPLPPAAEFEAAMSRLGIDATTQVVAYDESTGAMAAARLWWLLHWAGHTAVAVLDGGLKRWLAAGLPVAAGPEARPARGFSGRFQPELIAGPEAVLAAAGGPGLVVDSRTADRYRGENETIDPVAGHIPGALWLPYPQNLDQDGAFLSPEALRARFTALPHRAGPEATIFYCGSGVTAAHNVLAYAHAGLGMARLYPGSWSEWITDPSRPVATGSTSEGMGG